MELKKRLVDTSRLKISQNELETELFDVLHVYGYEEPKLFSLYKLLSALHLKRLSIVVLVKLYHPRLSYLSMKLAERLNLSTNLNTLLIEQLLLCIGTGHPSSNEIGPDDVLNALSVDVSKNIQGGRSFIIHGTHVNEGFYRSIYGELESKTKKQPDIAGMIVPIELRKEKSGETMDTLSAGALFKCFFLDEYSSEEKALKAIHSFILETISENFKGHT